MRSEDNVDKEAELVHVVEATFEVEVKRDSALYFSLSHTKKQQQQKKKRSCGGTECPGIALIAMDPLVVM